MDLSTALRQRFSHNDLIDQEAIRVCNSYLERKLGDSNADQKLASAHNNTFWQQFSEVLLADQLIKSGIHPLHKKVGPDFLKGNCC